MNLKKILLLSLSGGFREPRQVSSDDQEDVLKAVKRFKSGKQ